MKIKFLKSLIPLSVIFILFLSSCQHDMDLFVPDNTKTGQVINPSPVQASVNGIVTDENNNAVSGATVRSGSSTTTTDSRGLFRFTNITLDKYASVVTVDFNGYFKGIRTFSATQGGAGFVKIKLIPKTLIGNVDASAGGAVTLPNNAVVTLQSNSVVVKSTGQAYTGSINVYAANIDPTANDIAETIPGSFQATDENNFRVLLKSYGMLAVQLESQAGELLQIATSKTAKLKFTIPASLSSAAPSSIPLWSLNETDGLWKQEGQATKSGNSYEGDVAHFSFWNCDAGSNTVYLELNVYTSTGPLPGAIVKITRVSDGAASFGYTDSSGHVGGLVFSNEALKLEVLGHCYETIYSQNIGPFTQDTNLGTIVVTVPPEYSLVISGSAVNCSAMPVTNGNVFIYWEGELITTPIVDGNFLINITRCSSSSASVEIIVADNTTQQQSTTWTGTATTGNINTGTLIACGTSTLEFINYTVNGTDSSYTSPADSLYQYSTQGTAISLFIGSNSYGYVNIGMNYTGVGLGSSQPLQYFTANTIEGGGSTTISSPSFVSITEFGNVGEFIAGNFNAVLIGTITYNVQCSFRIRRQF